MVRDGYKVTEVGVIPEDWEVVDLGSLFQFKNGINATKEQYGTGYKFINVLDIIENEFITHDKIIGRVNVDASTYAKNEVGYGDIVFQRSSETAEEVGQAAVYLDETNTATFGGFVILGKKSGGFDSRYLNYQLQSPACRKEIVSQSGGSTRYNISQVSLRKAKAILPPTLTEQRAIATALSDTDALLSSLDALIGKTEAFKRGMMEGLLSGERRLDGFSGEWETKRLGEIGKLDKGKGVRKTDTIEKGIPCIRYAELYTLHGEIIQKFYSYIPKEVADTSRLLKAGEILFTCSGETKEDIGKSAAFCLDVEAYGGSDMIILNLYDGYDPVFMGYATNGSEVVKQKSAAGQGDAVVHISTSALALVELSLPSLSEQRAIAKVLSDLDAELSALRARRAKLGLVKGGMMEVLLSGAVRLV